MSKDLADANGYVLMQDTAWNGYEEIPLWIMQGYLTLGLEVLDQLAALEVMPTHCFLQAGVGSFPGAVAGFLTEALGDKAPKFIVVEPHAANCHYVSALAGDGEPHGVTGDLRSLMAGLACGEPNPISWGILRDYAFAFLSCPDYVAANGMRVLAAPLQGDPPVLSGESGASTAGALEWLCRRTPDAAAFRNSLELDENSVVLLVSTEGDTAPAVYRNVVWYGSHSDADVL